MPELLLACGAATDTGRLRENNEDRYWTDPARGVYLVADGLGGEVAGERAAELAVEAVRDAIEAPGDAKARVRSAIAAANDRIYARACANPEFAGMACVLTLALVEGDRVTIGHVGDSRLYLIVNREIRKLTNDHSPVGEEEDAGEVSEEEAMRHPRRHEIYRDVGSRPLSAVDDDFIEVRECRFPRRGALLLCSDGLTDQLTSLQIHEIIGRYSGDPADVARNLVDAANQAGGADNITALFVAGPDFHGRGEATRPRFSATRVRPRSGVRSLWDGLTSRVALTFYGLFLGALLWSVLHVRG